MTNSPNILPYQMGWDNKVRGIPKHHVLVSISWLICAQDLKAAFLFRQYINLNLQVPSNLFHPFRVVVH